MSPVRNRIFLLLVFLCGCSCYDPFLARKLAAMSYAAYCNQYRLAHWDVDVYSRDYPDITDVVVLQYEDTLVYLSYSSREKAVIVTFRGTTKLGNWLTDLDAWLVDFLPNCRCRVHKGFNEAYYKIKPQLQPRLDSYLKKYPGSRLIINGHSLGGALATIMAADLYSNGKQWDHLFTIGSPRVGDQGFRDYFENKVAAGRIHERVTNYQDPVPHLPLEIQQFVHINQEIYYWGWFYRLCSTTQEDKTCSWGQNWNIFNSQDHSTYLSIDSKSVVC